MENTVKKTTGYNQSHYGEPSESARGFLARLKKEERALERRGERLFLLKGRMQELSISKTITPDSVSAVSDSSMPIKAEGLYGESVKAVLNESRRLLSETQQAGQKIVTTRQLVTMGDAVNVGKIDIVPGSLASSRLLKDASAQEKSALRFLFEMIDCVLFELELKAKSQLSDVQKLRDALYDML